MFEIILADIIKLIPDSFLEGKQPTGNIYKIVKVFVEEINKDMQTLEDVFDITLLANQTGVTVDLSGADFGLFRNALDDDEFKIRIEAFKAGLVTGTDINSILALFRLLTGETGLNVRIKEKFDADLDNPRPRAFDIILDNTSTITALTFLPIALRVKGAGIEVTIDELSTNSFLTQGTMDYILQGNDDKIILEPGNLPPP